MRSPAALKSKCERELSELAGAEEGEGERGRGTKRAVEREKGKDVERVRDSECVC
jgi:hypothetical protein